MRRPKEFNYSGLTRPTLLHHSPWDDNVRSLINNPCLKHSGCSVYLHECVRRFWLIVDLNRVFNCLRFEKDLSDEATETGTQRHRWRSLSTSWASRDDSLPFCNNIISVHDRQEDGELCPFLDRVVWHRCRTPTSHLCCLVWSCDLTAVCLNPRRTPEMSSDLSNVLKDH